MRYNAEKRINVTAFSEEAKAAGLTGLPVSWGADGILEVGNITPEQRVILLQVIGAHDADAADAAQARAEEVRALRRAAVEELLDDLLDSHQGPAAAAYRAKRGPR